jgi:putative tryptophan/tyrosine transport system substrate-binding protein
VRHNERILSSGTWAKNQRFKLADGGHGGHKRLLEHETDEAKRQTIIGAVQIVAPSLGVELSPVDVRDAGEIERAVTAFARSSNGGLIVTGAAKAIIHRQSIIALAERHRLPAVYPGRLYVTAGGLVSYGADLIDQYRRAAGYVDRILKGEKPADMPVQAPTRYETVINLKAAKALGLSIPPAVLARAGEVIE